MRALRGPPQTAVSRFSGGITTTPQWVKEILGPQKGPEVVQVEMPVPTEPDVQAAEEYESGVAEDDAEAEILDGVPPEPPEPPTDVEPEPELHPDEGAVPAHVCEAEGC